MMYGRLNRRNSNGFTIVEILVAVAIMGFISAVMVSLVTIGLKTQKQTNLDAQASRLYRNFVALLNSDKAWKQTMVSPANSSLGCLTVGNCASANQSSAIRINAILDQDGTVAYQYSPTGGYTNQGVACPAGTSFNPAIGSGNDQCSLHYDIWWWPVCAGGGTCSDPTVHFKILPTYNPASKSTMPFNSLNYGTNDYIRGSDATSCNFTFDAASGQLTETCAKEVGIGTADASRASLVVNQPTSFSIYAQEWQRGSNILDLDVGVGGGPGGNPMALRSNQDFFFSTLGVAPQLYLKSANQTVGINTTLPNGTLSIGSTTDASNSVIVNANGGGTAGSYLLSSGVAQAGIELNLTGGNGALGTPPGATGFGTSNGIAAVITTSAVERMRIQPDGKVGIGTTSSSYPLTTAGNSGGAFGATPEIYANGDDHTGGGVLVSNDGGFFDFNDSYLTFLGSAGLRVAGNSGPNSSGLLTVNGRAGINTLTPQSALDVVPSPGGTLSALPGSFTGGIHTRDIALDNAVVVASNGVQTIRLATNPGNGQGEGRFTGALYARAFFYTSDERLKTDIEDLSHPLDRICQLHGVHFHWKSTGEEDMGFIAQEVKKVEPSLVSPHDPDSKNSMMSVKYGNIVALVVEAIKQIKAMLFIESERILKLEAENRDLRARLEAQDREYRARLDAEHSDMVSRIERAELKFQNQLRNPTAQEKAAAH